MDVSNPATAVSPGIDTDVFRVLAATTEPRTGREITRRSGRSKTGVQAVLDRLVEHGLVDRRQAGNAWLYTLNRDHVLFPVVEQMVAARTAFFDRLRQEIAGWKKPAYHASLFGSAARGDGNTESDIDFFIVRPAKLDVDDPVWRKQVDELVDAVERWTGNHAGISEVGKEELPPLIRRRPPVIKDLREDAVHLVGPSVRKLLGGRA